MKMLKKMIGLMRMKVMRLFNLSWNNQWLKNMMIQMMDCPGLPSHKYITSSMPAEETFTPSEDEWNQMKPTKENPHRLQAAWTNIIASHIAYHIWHT